MINGVSERGQNSVYLAESEAICVQFLFPPTEHTVQFFSLPENSKENLFVVVIFDFSALLQSRIMSDTVQ